MSLWNTAKALGLKCQVVPVMPSPYGGGYNYDDPTHLYEPKFRTFNGASSGGFELDECGPGWGYGMPDTKMTWLNGKSDASDKTDKGDEKAKNKTKTFKEVQMAYMTVSILPSQRHHATPRK